MILLWTALASPAHACDAAALRADVVSASPQGVANAFVALADCDADNAASIAGQALDKVLSGDAGNKLVIRAVEVGAGDEARDWIGGLQSDERSRTIAAVGGACSGDDGTVNAAISRFLVETHDQLGEDFWKERWYRSLADCREPGIQALLKAQIEKDPGRDYSRFAGVLEVYARNLGGDAVPTLVTLGVKAGDDAEMLTYIVNAFADAAQVGSLDGQDAAATAAAVKAITGMAASLPAQALDQARTTLLSMGAEAESSAMAGHRYAAEKRDDGKLHYGLIAVETATCKKGDTQIGVHVGEAVEPGNKWPDQVHEGIQAAVESGWSFEVASKCKGQGSVEVLLTDLPMGDTAAVDAWVKEQLREIDKREAKKRFDFEESALAL